MTIFCRLSFKYCHVCYFIIYYGNCWTNLLVLLTGGEIMIETEKTGIDACHDLIRKVDLSTDQGHAHALRGILGCAQNACLYLHLFCSSIY